MCFDEDHGLTSLAVLIECSPILEKLELEIDIEPNHCYENETCSGILEKCPDVWLVHMKELEIQSFINLKREMEFVKFIMARSPRLKKVIIHSLVGKDEESDMLKVLLQAPRASPVQIVVK
ncbi:putative FBD domain-containing protein [Helianthus debilis subsp. tardiflorus]